MTKELTTYIKNLLQSDTGLVEQDVHIYTVKGFRQWLKSNCIFIGDITEQSLMDFAANFKGINKTRFFYLSKQDFTKSQAFLLYEDQPQYVGHKQVGYYNSLPDNNVPDGQAYFMTSDEFLIYQHSAA